MQSDPKQHHHNPKFLLDGFRADESLKLFVYDLKKETIRGQIPKKVASETNFYSLLTNGKLDKSIEAEFGEIESKAALIIKKFKEAVLLTNQEKQDLAKFISLMRIRTPSFLENLGQLRIAFEETKLYEAGQNLEFTQQRTREISRDIVLQDPFFRWYWKFLEDNILTMKWCLFKAAPGKRFITSDNPLCSILELSDHSQNGISIINEFQDPSLRLYLPLSKKYCWLGHLSANEGTQYMADDKWMKMFERNTVKWANKFIYASTFEQAILTHAIEYRAKPFGISIPNTYPEFVLPDVQIKRVTLNSTNNLKAK